MRPHCGSRGLRDVEPAYDERKHQRILHVSNASEIGHNGFRNKAMGGEENQTM